MSKIDSEMNSLEKCPELDVTQDQQIGIGVLPPRLRLRLSQPDETEFRRLPNNKGRRSLRGTRILRLAINLRRAAAIQRPSTTHDLRSIAGTIA
jgi:hypothetical protein